MYLSARGAKSFMAMEGFVGITVSVAKNFYFFHLAIIFFRGGKKLQQPCLEQLIRHHGCGTRSKIMKETAFGQRPTLSVLKELFAAVAILVKIN
jgi:hypothetical protein